MLEPKTKFDRYKKKLEAEGWRKIGASFSPDAQDAIERLKARYGSFNAGMEAIRPLLDRLESEKL